MTGLQSQLETSNPLEEINSENKCKTAAIPARAKSPQDAKKVVKQIKVADLPIEI